MNWSWLAWSRWKTKIPEHWRPLRVENADESGSLMLGDTTQATAQIEWWSPSVADFDISQWMDKRQQSLWQTAIADQKAPGADRFDRTLWLPEARTRRGALSSVWYGYAKQAKLIIEVVINHSAGQEVLDLSRQVVLPSMDVSDPDAPTRWAVYSTRFVSPPGYEIYESRLNLGTIMLFLRKGKDRLVLCQFYPGTIALSKQPLADWLETSALKGKWHSKKDPQVREWRVGAFEGIRQERAMSRPFPLDLLGKSHCLSIIVHDKRSDRLLMAEHIHLMQTDEHMVTKAIEEMNWE